MTMTAFVLSVPFALRVLAWFLAGAALGGMVLLVVDRLRWDTPRISPWNAFVDGLWARWSGKKPPASKGRASGKPTRQGRGQAASGMPWIEFVPIVGWPGRFWQRPRLVEILCGLALAGLYYWEVGQWRLIPHLLPAFNPPPDEPPLTLAAILHVQYAKHAILLVFMLAASLIDLDEWIIPDWIAVPGTLIALAMAAIFPFSLLISEHTSDRLFFVDLAAPGAWPAALNAGEAPALWTALGCWWVWSLALMRRTLRLRRGWGVALRLFWARLATRTTLWLLLLGAVGSGAIFLVWRSGGMQWHALLTALVGMAVGGGLTWFIRVVCSVVLRREAMGFGDVTLMAMIGAFLGWQAAVLVFFIGPFFGLLIAVLALIRRDKVQSAMPYGPFLCLGATAVLLLWAPLWELVTARVVEVVWLVVYDLGYGPHTLAFAVALIIALLLAIQWLKKAFQRLKRALLGEV